MKFCFVTKAKWNDCADEVSCQENPAKDRATHISIGWLNEINNLVESYFPWQNIFVFYSDTLRVLSNVNKKKRFRNFDVKRCFWKTGLIYNRVSAFRKIFTVACFHKLILKIFSIISWRSTFAWATSVAYSCHIDLGSSCIYGQYSRAGQNISRNVFHR